MRSSANRYADVMNQRIAGSKAWPGTQAAEGLPRWHWTVAEIERVAAAGLFADGDRFELLGGEMVPMSPKGRRHEMIRLELSYRWTRMAPETVMVAAEPQFNLDADTYLNPDILVHSRSKATYDIRGPEALLVVEIAETKSRLRSQYQVVALCGKRRSGILGHQCRDVAHDNISAALRAGLHRFRRVFCQTQFWFRCSYPNWRST